MLIEFARTRRSVDTGPGDRLAARLIAVSAALLAFSVGNAADIAAGQAKVSQECAECHRPNDWSGETTAALQSLISDIVAGKVKHPRHPVNLTPQEIANIAAYWTQRQK